MSYTKQTWANGDVITADKLNHIEDGIASSAPWIIEMTFVDDGNVYLTSTAQWDDVAAAVCSGRTVMVKLPSDDTAIGYGVTGQTFQLLGYDPGLTYGTPAFLYISSYSGGGDIGTLSYFYKSDDGYLYGHIYVD